MKQQSHRLGDGPIDERYRRKLQALARTLDEWFNDRATGSDRKTGFVLMVFDLGEAAGRRINYISNADRADVVALLKQQVARFEGQPEPKEDQA